MRGRLWLGGAVALILAACGGSKNSPADPVKTTTVPAVSPAPVQPPAPAPAAAVTLASLTGDISKGRALFNQCKACHSDVAGANGIGPSLAGVVGRAAGSVPGYAYSAANKNSARTWNREALFTYLESPMRSIPGTKMTYAMANPQHRADVIAYLETLH